MKKTSILLAIALIMTGTAFAYAEDGADGADMVFTGDEIKLSLDGAEKAALAGGLAIEAAEANLKADKAKNRSYYENSVDIRSLQDAGLLASKSQRQMIDLASEFSKAQAQKNYDAAINQIVRDTEEIYYQVAQAQEAVRISGENVAVQETLYKNTQSKYNLGVVAKQDVLLAEIGLNNAKVSAQTAQTAYDNARMGFNIKFGYDLMQNITLTDTLTEVPVSSIGLGDAINKALENRNEIAGADFGLKMAELTLTETGNTVSKYSAQYMNAQVSLLKAQDAQNNAPKAVEMDVRSKYMDMQQKKAAVDLGKLNVANAQETYRLANLQYDAGMATLTDTQQAQLGAYQTELGYYSTLLAYNLSVVDYEQATTVGTSSIPL